MIREFFTPEEAADELSAQTRKKWTVEHIHQKAAVGQLPVCFLYRGHLGLFSAPIENHLAFATTCVYWVGYLRSYEVQTSLPIGMRGKSLDLLCPTNVTIVKPARNYKTIEVPNGQELRTSRESGEFRIHVVRVSKWLFQANDLATLIAESTRKRQEVNAPSKPWEIANQKDPEADQKWYVPARYFARQLVMEDSELLLKKLILAEKVSKSMAAVGIFKRGGKKPLAADTVLKAFVKVVLS